MKIGERWLIDIPIENMVNVEAEIKDIYQYAILWEYKKDGLIKDRLIHKKHPLMKERLS